jgi:hypothetical protein
MAGTGVEKIAEILDITLPTLRKHYRHEIFTSRERLKGKAVLVLNQNLDEGSLDAAKFVLTRIAGWTETQQITHNTAPELSQLLAQTAISARPFVVIEATPADDDDA